MACGMDAVRWRVHVHVLKQNEGFLITKSSSLRVCAFSDTELGEREKFLSCSCRPRIYGLSHSRKSGRVYCEKGSVGDAGDQLRNEALSVVVRSLLAAGIEEEDAVRISLKCPHFIQKLVGRSSEADEIVRWANLSLGAEGEGEGEDFGGNGSGGVVELSGPERWSVVLEFVGVHPQATARISRVLSDSSLPEFLKKVCSLQT